MKRFIVGLLLTTIASPALAQTAQVGNGSVIMNTTTKAVRFPGLSAGVMQTDGSGNVSVGGGIQSKLLSGNTRDLTAASGNVSYTGMGFRPTTCNAFGTGSGSTIDYVSIFGFADSSRSTSSIATFSAAANFTRSAGLLAFFDASGTASQVATVASYDADGLTLTWTKTSSPSGTATFDILCYR